MLLCIYLIIITSYSHTFNILRPTLLPIRPWLSCHKSVCLFVWLWYKLPHIALVDPAWAMVGGFHHPTCRVAERPIIPPPEETNKKFCDWKVKWRQRRVLEA